ncbi:MAG: EamA family transporter, partial [Pelosinus sp.]|nr:EamA family transporter [Pelosinus sp.]
MHKKDICMALVVVIAWGLNFIAINMGLREMPPLLLGALRFFMATVPAIFFLPRPSVSWSWLIALGLSINVGQFAFLFMSMKVGMPAGLASLLLQAQAFFTLVFAVLWFGQRWHFNNIAGLLLAFSGIVLIGLQQGGSMTQLGFCLII